MYTNFLNGDNRISEANYCTEKPCVRMKQPAVSLQNQQTLARDKALIEQYLLPEQPKQESNTKTSKITPPKSIIVMPKSMASDNNNLSHIIMPVVSVATLAGGIAGGVFLGRKLPKNSFDGLKDFGKSVKDNLPALIMTASGGVASIMAASGISSYLKKDMPASERKREQEYNQSSSNTLKTIGIASAGTLGGLIIGNNLTNSGGNHPAPPPVPPQPSFLQSENFPKVIKNSLIGLAIVGATIGAVGWLNQDTPERLKLKIDRIKNS